MILRPESGGIMPFQNLSRKLVQGPVLSWNGLLLLYNSYILIEVFEKPWWWLLLSSIPSVNLLFLNWMYDLLVRLYGQSKRLTVATVSLGIVFQFLLPVMLHTMVIQVLED